MDTHIQAKLALQKVCAQWKWNHLSKNSESSHNHVHSSRNQETILIVSSLTRVTGRNHWECLRLRLWCFLIHQDFYQTNSQERKWFLNHFWTSCNQLQTKIPILILITKEIKWWIILKVLWCWILERLSSVLLVILIISLPIYHDHVKIFSQKADRDKLHNMHCVTSIKRKKLKN